MKVFLTGGTGYVGSHIALELSHCGHEVSILTRSPEANQELGDLPGISLVEGSLAETAKFGEWLQDHDALVHNAVVWNDQPDGAVPDLTMPEALFQAAADANHTQAIYTSSTAVHRPFSNYMTENSHIGLKDLDQYAIAKYLGELTAETTRLLRKLPFSIIRLAPVVGPPALPTAPFKSHRQLDAIVDAALRNEPINVRRKDGRQFVAAPDAAKVFRTMLGRKQPSGIYLVADKRITTWEQIARWVVEAAQSQSDIVVEEPAVGPALFGVNKLERQLSFVLDSTASMQEHIRWAISSARNRLPAKSG
jgi:nucleoside-diphosphate-sugar epimerase